MNSLLQSTAFRRGAHTALFTSLFFVIQLHVITLQLFAWSQMIIDYADDRSVAAAVVETFTGPPCEFCLAIDATQSEHETDPLLTPARLIVLLPDSCDVAPPPITAQITYSSWEWLPTQGVSPPPERPG